MGGINPAISIITLNIYGTNGSVLKAEIAKMNKKARLNYVLLGEMYFICFVVVVFF